MSAAQEDEGLESAAILLMTLGEEQAAEVFKHLAPREVQRLGETITRMKAVPRERVDAVMDRLEKTAGNDSALVPDNQAYVNGVLRRALGEDKAALLIDRIGAGSSVAGIDNLRWMDPAAVAELMRNEHPQIVAAILVHLEADQTAAVLKLFGERQRNEVMVRIATLDGIQPAALRDLNEVMSKVLAGGGGARKASLGGAKTAAEILNMLGSAIETAVLDFVREADNDLAQKIMDNMFTFDDVEKVDDKGLESRGPVRLSEVEAEQKEMLKIVRRLADEGQIVLAGGGDGDFV